MFNGIGLVRRRRVARRMPVLRMGYGLGEGLPWGTVNAPGYLGELPWGTVNPAGYMGLGDELLPWGSVNPPGYLGDNYLGLGGSANKKMKQIKAAAKAKKQAKKQAKKIAKAAKLQKAAGWTRRFNKMALLKADKAVAANTALVPSYDATATIYDTPEIAPGGALPQESAFSAPAREATALAMASPTADTGADVSVEAASGMAEGGMNPLLIVGGLLALGWLATRKGR